MTSKRNTHFPVLDGGIGWLVVVAGVISNFISMGLYRSGGIIYLTSIKHFSASRSIAAWIPMTTIMFVFFTAPIATFLATRFSFHRIIILGASLATLGMVISFVATTFEVLFIGWSLFFGIGSSLVFCPSMSVVSQCFKTKRPLANGIVLAASGVGGSCLTPLLEYLIDIYGLNGACLILAGVVAHYFLVGILLRTVYFATRKPAVLELEVTTFDNDEKDYKILSKSKLSMDIPFVKNWTFYINAVTNAIQTALFFATLTILPDLGVAEIGVSRLEGAYLVSASAFADMASRLPAGIIFLKIKMRLNICCIVVLIINVVDLILLAFVTNYFLAMIGAAISGLCFAFGVLIYFEILASCQSPKKFPIAFGLSEMIKVPFLLLAGTTVGSLKDATGSYSMTFVIFAVVQSLVVILWAFQILCSYRNKK